VQDCLWLHWIKRERSVRRVGHWAGTEWITWKNLPRKLWLGAGSNYELWFLLSPYCLQYSICDQFMGVDWPLALVVY